LVAVCRDLAGRAATLDEDAELNALSMTSVQAPVPARVADTPHALRWTSTQTRLIRERADGLGPPPLVVAIELDGPVDADRLDAAWQEAQRRQPFLRLRIGPDGPFASGDVSSLARANLPGSSLTFRAEVSQILGATARPRDLAIEGPVDAVLIRTGPEASFLICSIDHLAADGWSFGLLAREWSALYRGISLPPVPDPNVVIDRHNDPERLRAHAIETSSLADELAGAQPFVLAASTSGWALQQIDLPLDVAKALRTRAAKERSTPFAFALAALAYALSIEHGASDLIVSTHVANRSVPQSEQIVCAMYNTVPIRLSAASAGDLDAWLSAAKPANLRALQRQAVPFATVRDAVAATLPAEALLRVMINCDEHPFLGFLLPGVEIQEATIWNQKRMGTGLYAPWFAESSTPWPAGITVSFRETWSSLQLYVHYGSELGDRGATMLLGRVAEGLASLTDEN
jgi:Condensation domain